MVCSVEMKKTSGVSDREIKHNKGREWGETGSCMCARERERERKWVCVCVWKWEREKVSVCVRNRETASLDYKTHKNDEHYTTRKHDVTHSYVQHNSFLR